MTNADVLLASTLAVPLAMLSACLSQRWRNRMPALLALAPVPAFAAAVSVPTGSTLVLPRALLGLTLELDGPGAMLLGTAALLWAAAGAFVRFYLQDRPDDRRLVVWWLMTLVGSVGVFIAADMVGFYLFYTLVSLAAYGLVTFNGTASAKRAGAVYVAFALLGEAFLLMGFVLLRAATADGSLLIRDAVAALPNSPWRDPTLLLLVMGFGLKIGLVPLHVWMPLAYSSAPTSAAAVLSGAAVKAGVIGLIRFLPLETAYPGWGEALAAVGLFSAFYGVAIGIVQSNPKVVLAYSSVSQMGLVAAVIGMGVSTGDASVAVSAAFYAMHHILLKGGLFLAIGLVERTGLCRPWPVLLPAAVLALGLGGLPLTGGALAKFAITAPLGGGLASTLATLSAIGTALLMVHFLRCLKSYVSRPSATPAPRGLTLPWLGAAFASIALPWALYPIVARASWPDALAPEMLWAAVWPVAVGALLAVVLHRWQHLLPRIPEGDILAFAKSARPARNLGAAMEGIDADLRQWPVAGVLFLAVGIILAGVTIAWP